jgi:hypothetical protein
MPVFISYSRSDSKFVEKLAHQLVAHKAYVWLDKWELRVGDSLLEKIQDAVEGSSALLVVLSKASIESEWCKRELNSGLLRELEEKRIVVMPVLIEDCKVPMFVRGKLYADFRSNFDEGLRALLEGIAAVTSTSLGRLDEPEFYVDWAIDGYESKNQYFALRITLIEHAVSQPYSCLTEVTVLIDEAGTALYKKRLANRGEDYAQLKILQLLVTAILNGREIRLQLSDQFSKDTEMLLSDPRSKAKYFVSTKARRLGEDTGRDILLDVGGQLVKICKHLESVLKSSDQPQ